MLRRKLLKRTSLVLTRDVRFNSWRANNHQSINVGTLFERDELSRQENRSLSRMKFFVQVLVPRFDPISGNVRM